MPTTSQNVLTSVKTGISTNPEADILSALKKERKILAASNDPDEVTEAVNYRKAALTYIKQTAAVIAAAGPEALGAHLQVLAQAWDTLPLDEADPTVVDRKKVRNQTRDRLTEALALTPPAPPAVDNVSWLAPRLEMFKRSQIGDYQNSDPCEAQFTAARAVLAAPSNLAAVQAAIATINKLAHLLAPN